MSGTRFGLLSYPGIFNLGDVIQSLAAKRFLPRVDVRIPRERISDQPEGDGPIGLIANGWFMNEPRNWPPHSAIVPLLVSMHFAANDFARLQRWRKRPLDRLLFGTGAEYLRNWGPVGARDRFSSEELSKRGIPNYVSGCLTTTLTRPSDAPREDFVVACDLTGPELERLRQVTDCKVVETTHRGRPFASVELQEQEAERVLELYSRAAAVVTNRIHAALPCLGFTTPVLLVTRSPSDRRVSDIAELAHSCSAADFLAGRYDFDFRNPPPNPETFRQTAEMLDAICQSFVMHLSARSTNSS